MYVQYKVLKTMMYFMHYRNNIHDYKRKNVIYDTKRIQNHNVYYIKRWYEGVSPNF